MQKESLCQHIRILHFIGVDDWDRPVYRDDKGILWKDVNMGQEIPYLHNSSNNEMDGEPDTPIKGQYRIDTPFVPVDESMKFNYMMLSRLKSDCEYFLGHGNRHDKHLWAGNPAAQISEMKRLWSQFSQYTKPEWLTWDEIIEYEQKMVTKQETPVVIRCFEDFIDHFTTVYTYRDEVQPNFSLNSAHRYFWVFESGYTEAQLNLDLKAHSDLYDWHNTHDFYYANDNMHSNSNESKNLKGRVGYRNDKDYVKAI